MWSTERILALAPDDSAARAGQALASARKWAAVGRNQRALWGEVQGSGAKPYQVQIDLTEPALKCSCPSRKLPCKHALGLFLLLGPAEDAAPATAPAWVTNWLDKRDQAAEKKQGGPAGGETAGTTAQPAADPQQQARRRAAREAKMATGMADLGIFLTDLMRQGLARAQCAKDAGFNHAAARLVDAQAPGAARMLHDIGDLLAAGSATPHWHARLVDQIGRLYLLVRSYPRLAQLPEDIQVEIATLLGVPVRDEQLRDQPAVEDVWHVLGQKATEKDRLRTQRTWLMGERTNRYALVLDFAYAGQPFKHALVSGTRFSGEIVYYPGLAPLRAVIRTRRPGPEEPAGGLSGYGHFAAAFAAYSAMLAKNPFVEIFPALLSNVRVGRGKSFLLADCENQSVQPYLPPPQAWQLLAISGGQPVDVFAEFDGHLLTPLSVRGAGGLHAF